MRLSSDRVWLSTLAWGRRGRRLLGELLVAAWASMSTTGGLGGKRKAGEDGRW
ncbi:MAG TPA: hypothetical protein VMS62_15320 [Gemmatimonadales bacterium]|nr:hypothetical protein [Gemmatimonadales bacterium]